MSHISWNLFFFRLLWTGYKSPLTDEKVWDLRPRDKVRTILKSFYDNWLKTSKKTGHHSYDNLDNNYMYGVNVDSSKLQHGAVGNEYQEMNDHSQYNTTSTSEKTPLLGKQMSQGLSVQLPPSSNTFRTWKTKSGVLKSLWKSFGLYYSLSGIYELLNLVLTFIRPLILE
jgi:hypothetical protein